jgi:hypothetical protein
MKTVISVDRVASKIDDDIVELVFSEKSTLTTDILAEEVRPDESLMLRQAIGYASMIRITNGDEVADLYIDGVLRTMYAFKLQADKDK